MENFNKFSFFKAPVINVQPCRTLGLRDVYNIIISDLYKEKTIELRNINDRNQASVFKARHFDYCTFSGVFSRRSAKNLIAHSGLLTVDFDHVQNLNQLYSKLLYDEYFETQLLFRSPSGDGLKWIIKCNTQLLPHQGYFNAVANYIEEIYDIKVDRSGSDVARACFLCWDPAAYLNPEL